MTTVPDRHCRSGRHLIPEGQKKCPVCANEKKRLRLAQKQGLPLGIECPVCHKRFHVLTVGHARTHGFLDLATFKVTFGIDFCTSEDRRQRISKDVSQNGCKWGWGRDRTSNGQQGLKRTPESRAKMSLAASLRCRQQPRANPFAGTKGEWVFSVKARKRVYVRSSYEKRLLRVLDAHPGVLWLEMEPLSIPYEFEGVTRYYIPDFLVTLEDDIQELWEVKPLRFVGTLKNKAKFEALCTYAFSKGMNAALLTLEDIEKLEHRVAALFPALEA